MTERQNDRTNLTIPLICCGDICRC